MLLELSSIIFFLLFSFLLARTFWRAKTGAGSKRVIVLFWGLTLAIFIAAAFGSRKPQKAAPPEDRPIAVSDGGYVTSKSCRTCHPGEYKTWHASYHRTMTQLATPESVCGDFDEVEVEFDGVRYTASERKGEFFVEMSPTSPSLAGPQSRSKLRMALTTGSHHMQIYWHPTGDGRKLSLVPIVYLRDQQRWIPREAAFVEPPTDEPPDNYGLWNHMCIKCHATNGRPRVTNIKPHFAGSPMDTHVSEFGISCEACHGPGEQHAKLNRDPQRRYGLHFSDKADDSIVNPSRLTHVRSTQVCGQCHSVKTYFDKGHFDAVHFGGSSYRPGDDLDEHENVFCNANLGSRSIQEMTKANPDFKQNSFWDDGMVRVSGREYNGLIESPCYQRGEMSCLSCHTMHKPKDDNRSLSAWANDQLGPKMESNQACLQCHDEFSDEQSLTEHTHHLPESSGSSCYNCHMPHTTYGLLKSIRSHEISVPMVSETLQFGRPNACNLCHLDRSLVWSSKALHDWYGHQIPEMTTDQQNVAASVLWALKGDAGLRALTANAMQWEPAKSTSGSDWFVPYLTNLMNDSYIAVRLIAYRGLRKLPRMQDSEFDEFASEDKRSESVTRILQQWRATSQERTGHKKATLLDKDGELDDQEFHRILEQRDNRPVFLAE